jgi:transposase
MATYGQPTLNNFRAEKGYYTTKEVSEIYHVSQATVCNWCRKKWLEAEMKAPGPGGKSGRSRWQIFPQQLEDIETHKDELIELSRRYWVSLLAKMRR